MPPDEWYYFLLGASCLGIVVVEVVRQEWLLAGLLFAAAGLCFYGMLALMCWRVTPAY